MSETTATENAILDELEAIKDGHSIQPGTPAYEAFLAAGYSDIGTVEHAQEIVAEREKDHSAYPWELYMKAKAYLEAYNAKPEKWVSSHPPTDRRGNIIEAKAPGRRGSRK